MVWGQILDPNVGQDTVRKLSSTAFYWCHKNMAVPLCVCVYSLTGCESLCHDGVSTHRPVLSPNLEAALNKIKVLPQ
jgi:hypothetical protein